MSERDRVMQYLYGRYRAAWNKGDIEEARSCFNFFLTLEEMTDSEYLAIYTEEPLGV